MVAQEKFDNTLSYRRLIVALVFIGSATMLDTQAQYGPAALAVSEETHRNAYNAAFCELELGWRWDAGTYLELLGIPEEKRRIRAYVQRHQAHLLRAYDIGFLSDLIYETKRRWHEELSRAAPPAR
jgi:hypothetical protein